MSNLIHCDGPNCDVTREPDYSSRALFEGGWLSVTRGEGVRPLDFHSNECLANWNAEQPGTTTKVVDGR